MRWAVRPPRWWPTTWRSAATRDPSARFCGKPCNSNSGGPLPPTTQLIVISPIGMGLRAKPSNTAPPGLFLGRLGLLFALLGLRLGFALGLGFDLGLAFVLVRFLSGLGRLLFRFFGGGIGRFVRGGGRRLAFGAALRLLRKLDRVDAFGLHLGLFGRLRHVDGDLNRDLGVQHDADRMAAGDVY